MTDAHDDEQGPGEDEGRMSLSEEVEEDLSFGLDPWGAIVRSLGIDSMRDKDDDRLDRLRDWVGAIRDALLSLRSDYPLEIRQEALEGMLRLEEVRRRREVALEERVLAMLEKFDTLSEEERKAEVSRLMDGPRDVDQAPPVREVLKSALMVEFVLEYIAGVRPAAERALTMLEHLVPGDLPTHVALSLMRVARLHVAGWHQEGVVFARSTLDAAFAVHVTDEVVLRFLPNLRQPSRIDLHERIIAARKSGLLTEAEKDSANWIRIRGNDAVHPRGLPDGFRGDMDYVAALARVLRRLYATRKDAEASDSPAAE